MIFPPWVLLAPLMAVLLPEKSFATPILASNNDLHNTTARSVIQPREDWNKVAAEIRGDNALIQKLNTIGADCDDNLSILGVEKAKQQLVAKKIP
ncbi:hypothetical protein NUU61_008496 [Penicillium alfredii]|uniref:Uncharacterized protein n=1 Tax=Penicillium alfredii TaxID=1506179 RepID=A0A9W9ELB5_9EURO|nr:uncharacterized protein NUU61_008496 [Penicillium alfredii]KAJ5083917.1 hypothetical protein NUU61_008496 [Penicillium alfredii]